MNTTGAAVTPPVPIGNKKTFILPFPGLVLSQPFVGCPPFQQKEDHSTEHAAAFISDPIAFTYTSRPRDLEFLCQTIVVNVAEDGFSCTLALSDAPGIASTPSKSPSHAPGTEPAANSSTAAAASTSTTDAAAGPAQRRRFTDFHFHKRSPRQGERSAGSLLLSWMLPRARRVSDLGLVSWRMFDLILGTPDANSTDDDKDGVKVMIRLAALDEHGREMEVINEQVTYLQVVRFGAAPTTEKKDDAAATTVKKEGEASTDAATKAEDEDSEDTRPWVVKFVKREATLGPHTFHLHEIYGLSSATSDTSVEPTAPLPKSGAATDGEAGEHTYPPTSPVVPTVVAAHEEETTSECLLCLSSPREVVLLPWLFIIDLAHFQVEFGAGSSITQPADDTPAAGGDATPAGAGGANSPDDSTADTDATNATPAAPAPTRRKRKAEVWFRPVCRQPYASLLRITPQQPPPQKLEEEDGGEKAEVDNGAEGGSGGDGILGSITRP
ncbi:hypothetical protein DL96DRAFT_1562958 [Flagelloscypha sp. PMI_526]|nr:hypothetical protein DL96DRAFT_1562958 [Flagelloscypha sp. PMI_526]